MKPYSIKQQPIQLRNPIDQKKLEGKMRQAAKLYEREFLNEMVKAMRTTVEHSEMSKPSMGEQIYMDQMFDKYVDNWSENGGVGFADIIYNQLVEKYSPFKQSGLSKPNGPLPLNENPQQLKMQQIENQAGGKAIKIDLEPATPEAEVKSPWAGKLTQKIHLDEEGLNFLEIDHGQGLKSKLVFSGTSNDLTVGQNLEAGESLGQAMGAKKALEWTIFA